MSIPKASLEEERAREEELAPPRVAHVSEVDQDAVRLRSPLPAGHGEARDLAAGAAQGVARGDGRALQAAAPGHAPETFRTESERVAAVRAEKGAELGEVVGDDELVLAPQKPFKNVVYLLRLNLEQGLCDGYDLMA